jgi:glycosyltransferase involved in cell wall biosynthesis
MTEPPNKPLISVVMPVYNSLPHLREAVESVLEQTLGDFELLAIDDGSSDGSAEVLAEYAKRDGRLRVIRQANGGVTAAICRGLDEARGPLIARMDADDICLPERFAKQVAYLRAHPECVAVGSAARVIDEDGDELFDDFNAGDHDAIDRWHMEKRCARLCHPSMMIRAEALRSVGGYCRQRITSQDFDLWLKLAETGRLACLDEPLVKYRVHPKSVTSSRAAQQMRDVDEAIRQACERRGLPTPVMREAVQAHVAPEGPYAELILRTIAAGRVGAARRLAGKLLWRSPQSVRRWRMYLYTLLGRRAWRLHRLLWPRT